jgi:hypothetical protein
MNLMNVVISRLCFISDCVFFYKLNVDCVFYPAVMREVTSASPSLLEPRPRNNPQVVGEIRAEKTYTTHMNTMESISFCCSKFGCIFCSDSSVYIDLLHGK